MRAQRWQFGTYWGNIVFISNSLWIVLRLVVGNLPGIEEDWGDPFYPS